MSPSETQQRQPRPVTYAPEYGDVADVRRVFGLRETHLYGLYYSGKIKAVLIPGPKGRRGKRLFDFESIRSYLAQHVTTKEPPKKEVAAP